MFHAVIELFYWLYSIVLLKPHIGHINIIQFRQKELCYHVAISSTINSCCLTSLSKKYGLMMPPAQNPHQTVTPCGCICFSLITRGFSEPQTRQFWRLIKPSRWKCASSIILLEKPASTFWWLIIIKTRYCISAVKLFFFQSCQQLNAKMAANSNLNFGTLFT